MDQNPLSNGGTLPRDSTGLGLRNKPSIMIITDHQPLNHKYLTRDTSKDSGIITEEEEHKPLALNSREEILMQWIP
jgi:hypothetical protein